MVTPTSGSPLSSGARADSGSLRCRAQGGSPQLQSTGRARQKRAKGLGRGRLEKNPQKAQPAPPLPALTLEFRSSNPQPPLTPRPLPSHSPHSNIHTQGLCRCHWLPFSPSPWYEWPDEDKTPQQLPQEVQPLGVGTESPCSV